MQTKQIQIYNFEELNKKAKEKVIGNFREDNDYSFLEENLNELLKEKLKENKIVFDNDLKVYYSLSYCQGDGLCFIGKFNFKGFDFNINHNSNYYYKNSTEIFIEDEFEEDNLKNILKEKLRNNTEKEFKEIYSKICDDLEKIGYEEIEYKDSEENIKEIINLNEYTFRENGEIENL